MASWSVTGSAAVGLLDGRVQAQGARGTAGGVPFRKYQERRMGKRAQKGIPNEPQFCFHPVLQAQQQQVIFPAAAAVAAAHVLLIEDTLFQRRRKMRLVLG